MAVSWSLSLSRSERIIKQYKSDCDRKFFESVLLPTAIKTHQKAQTRVSYFNYFNYDVRLSWNEMEISPNNFFNNLSSSSSSSLEFETHLFYTILCQDHKNRWNEWRMKLKVIPDYTCWLKRFDKCQLTYLMMRKSQCYGSLANRSEQHKQ